MTEREPAKHTPVDRRTSLGNDAERISDFGIGLDGINQLTVENYSFLEK